MNVVDWMSYNVILATGMVVGWVLLTFVLVRNRVKNSFLTKEDDIHAYD